MESIACGFLLNIFLSVSFLHPLHASTFLFTFEKRNKNASKSCRYLECDKSINKLYSRIHDEEVIHPGILTENESGQVHNFMRMHTHAHKPLRTVFSSFVKVLRKLLFMNDSQIYWQQMNLVGIKDGFKI